MTSDKCTKESRHRKNKGCRRRD